MDAKQLLSQLPSQFQGQLSPLTSGLTNQSWRLTTPHARFWLRLGHVASESLGIDRQQELLAHQAAAQAGLSPKVRYAQPSQGILILDWLSEPHWQAPFFSLTKTHLARLATQVAKLHQLAPAVTSINLMARAEFYLCQLSDLSADLLHLARSFEQSSLNLDYVPVFCHHDLNAANIMGARPWLLDWEYAGLGDAAFELAVIADSFKLTEQGEQHLLASYKNSGAPMSERRFQARKPWVQWLSLLWAKVQYQHTAQATYQTIEHQARSQLRSQLKRYFQQPLAD
ncbi:choline kinase family protein [Oceanisphaera avium]|uniref:Aminoglycoside phosphotransferase domain-containing protein n=1 Tax=Oceanisphaera avium TaxID=1903694 RepID=A0A1Y0CUS5_9GAMM|nr:choline kinase family protein [Oceanisphaera avium]ART78999.1 hypothetical protein CBP12_01580 [Oceanisphaera avium]